MNHATLADNAVLLPHHESRQSNPKQIRSTTKDKSNPLFLTLNFNGSRHTNKLHNHLSMFISRKWAKKCDKRTRLQVIERLGKLPISLKTLKDKNKSVRIITKDDAKIANSKFSFIEKYFSKVDTQKQMLYLYKIYKFGFCIPYLRNLSLKNVRRSFYKFLQHVRNRYLRSKNYENDERQMLECSFDINHMNRYVKRKTIIENVYNSSKRGNLLKLDSLVKENPRAKPHPVINLKLKRTRLSTINISLIVHRDKIPDTLTDIRESHRMLNRNDDHINVNVTYLDNPLLKIYQQSTMPNTMSFQEQKLSSISRFSKNQPTIGASNSNNNLNPGSHNVIGNPNEKKSIFRVDSINVDPNYQSRDSFKTDSKLSVPLPPVQLNSQNKVDSRRLTNINIELTETRKPSSLPPIDQRSNYKQKTQHSRMRTKVTQLRKTEIDSILNHNTSKRPQSPYLTNRPDRELVANNITNQRPHRPKLTFANKNLHLININKKYVRILDRRDNTNAENREIQVTPLPRYR